MDGDKVVLTAHELRVLADVETSLRREEPALERALGTRRVVSGWLTSKLVVAFAAALSITLMIGGLLSGQPIMSFAGFVVLVAALHALIPRWDPTDARPPRRA